MIRKFYDLDIDKGGAIPLSKEPTGKEETIVNAIITAQIGTRQQHDVIQAHMTEYFKRWPNYKSKLNNLEWYHLFLDFYDVISSPSPEPERIEKAITQMDKSVKSLYLELPESIANHVSKNWGAVKAFIAGAKSEREEMRCLKILLRELTMRSQIAFPEDEQDLEWFDEGLVGQTELFETIFETLGLGSAETEQK